MSTTLEVATNFSPVACPPDGLLNKTAPFRTPDRSSATTRIAVTLAGPLVTSTEVGVKEKSSNRGGVVSSTETTDSSVGKPMAARSARPHPILLPAWSESPTDADHVPASMN